MSMAASATEGKDLAEERFLGGFLVSKNKKQHQYHRQKEKHRQCDD
jgi:hypothetical protein